MVAVEKVYAWWHFFPFLDLSCEIFHEVLYVTLGIISKKKKNIPTSPSHFTRYVSLINCTRPPRHWVASQSGVSAPTPWRLALGVSGLLLSQRVGSPTFCSWCVWSKNVYRPRGTLATWQMLFIKTQKTKLNYNHANQIVWKLFISPVPRTWGFLSLLLWMGAGSRSIVPT